MPDSAVMPNETIANAASVQSTPTDGQAQEANSQEAVQSQGQGTEAATQETLDANKYLHSLPPEQRQLVEPVIKQWQAGYTKQRMKETSELKAIKQHADAFGILRSDPRFVKWYYDTVRAEQEGAQKQTEPQVSEDTTDEEIADAVVNADAKKIREIITREASKIAGQESRKIQVQRYQDNLEHQMESLARENPDFDKLDSATDTGLAPYMYYFVDVEGKSPVEAYAAAKQFWNAAVKEAQSQIMAQTQKQKQFVTEPPSSLMNQSGIILADEKTDPLDLAIREALQGRHTEVRKKR